MKAAPPGKSSLLERAKPPRERPQKKPGTNRQPASSDRAKLSLNQAAYRRLEEMIVTLELAPDEVVSEPILSRRIGIGTTPIREALQRLAREHLVRIIPRRGVVVTPVDVRQQLEVLETRRELDRLLAKMAARRSSAAEKERIAALAESTGKAAAAGDVHEFLRLDAQLNDLLAVAARNAIAAETSATLHSVSRRFWFYHLNDKQHFSETATLHLAMVKAIASGDERAAGAASDRLVNYLADFAQATLPRP